MISLEELTKQYKKEQFLDYLNSIKGLYAQYHCRSKKYCYYDFNTLPLSKKAMKPNTTKQFQLSLYNQLKTNKRRAYKSDIALEINLFSNDKTPPNIYKATKNLLDIMGKPINKNINRKGLLYYDDSQIKYLSVNYMIGTEFSRISIESKPFNNFLADLNLAYECFYYIKNKKENMPDDAFDFYKDLEINRNIYISKFGIKTYNVMLKFEKNCIQNELFTTTSLKLFDIYSIYKAENCIKNNSKYNINIYEGYSKFIRESPFKIALPSPPHNQYITTSFKNDFKLSLTILANKLQKYLPLQVPISIQVFYKPPKHNFQNKRDLDNIINLFIPSITEILNPPMLSTSNPQRIKDRGLSGFEIMLIPRQPEDNTEGYLVVSFSNYECGLNSITSSISKNISEAEPNIDKFIL